MDRSVLINGPVKEVIRFVAGYSGRLNVILVRELEDVFLIPVICFVRQNVILIK